MANPAPILFGFLDDLVEISFPQNKFLTVECSFISDSPASANGEGFSFKLPAYFPNQTITPLDPSGNHELPTLFPTNVLSYVSADPPNPPQTPPKIAVPLSADALKRTVVFPQPPDATLTFTATTGAGVAFFNLVTIKKVLAKAIANAAQSTQNALVNFEIITSPHGTSKIIPPAKVWWVYSSVTGDITSFTKTTFSETFYGTDNPYTFTNGAHGGGVLNDMITPFTPGTKSYVQPFTNLADATAAAAYANTQFYSGEPPGFWDWTVQEWDLGSGGPPVYAGKCSWNLRLSTYSKANGFEVNAKGQLVSVTQTITDPNTQKKTSTPVLATDITLRNSGGNNPVGYTVSIIVNLSTLKLTVNQAPT